MANRNPWQARLARYRKRWPAPIDDIQADAYAVLMIAYEGVAVDDPEQRRKNILAYCQALTAFAKLREGIELEARIAALEAALQRRIVA